MKLRELAQDWKENILPALDQEDEPMCSESWTCYIDRQLSNLLNFYAPAWDELDDVPGPGYDDELEWLLDKMGVSVDVVSAGSGLFAIEPGNTSECDWVLKLSRGNKVTTILFVNRNSEGEPDEVDVMTCLLGHRQYVGDSFDEFAEAFGFDEAESKAAAVRWAVFLHNQENLAKLFTKDELNELEDIADT